MFATRLGITFRFIIALLLPRLTFTAVLRLGHHRAVIHPLLDPSLTVGYQLFTTLSIIPRQ